MFGQSVGPRRSLRAPGLVALVVVALLSVQAYADVSPASEGRAIRRYGLFIGANDGGAGRGRLVFAESDSRAMAKVMEEVGGLDPADAVVLQSPSISSVRRNLKDMGERINRERADSRRVEFLLYYSGHSDEEALMLGNERLEYGELRDQVRGLGADISIAILDSCASGAFIRIKGGERRPAFLVDESSAVQGQVYLTSSSENEASQESDSLGGSFFTHSLISGLRGAADFSLDGKVTLHEAYQYASSETLARTENTQAGPQHPSWYINLNGTGDLVLTDLRSTTAGLTLSEDIEGKLYIRDASGTLVAEVRKSRGVPLSLALPPGTYAIASYTDERSREARIVLRSGAWSSLAGTEFRDSSKVATRTRGDEPDEGGSDADRARELVQGLFEGDDGYIAAIGEEVRDRVQRKVEEALARVQGGSEAEAARPLPDERAGRTTEGGASEPEAEPDVPLVPFSIGLVPGVGYPFAGQARTVVSLNAVIGVSYAIAGFEASGVMNITSHEVRGAQLAGVGNIVAGGSEGLQSAGVMNIVSGEARGVQTAGVFNIAARGAEAAQIAGVFNVAEGPSRGLQLAGVFNTAHEAVGGQIGGVFNITPGDFDGVQIAGVFNAAGKTRGVQIGVVNVGGDVQGLQLGVVNISRSLHGVALGIVNIVPNGLMLGSVSWDDRGFAALELDSGRLLYTVLAGGVRLSDGGVPLAASAQIGLGLHFTMGPFFISGDISARSMVGLPGGLAVAANDAIPFPSLRARAGMLLWGTVGGYVGYAADVQLGEGFWVNTIAHTGEGRSFDLGGHAVTLYPRFVMGISVGRQPS